MLPKPFFRCSFPGGSAGKESACSAGDPGSIPGSGRAAGEGIGHRLQCSWAPLVAQLATNLPAMQETWVRSLGWEDRLEKGKAPHCSILAWRTPWTVHGAAGPGPTEQLALSVFRRRDERASDLSGCRLHTPQLEVPKAPENLLLMMLYLKAASLIGWPGQPPCCGGGDSGCSLPRPQLGAESRTGLAPELGGGSHPPHHQPHWDIFQYAHMSSAHG